MAALRVIESLGHKDLFLLVCAFTVLCLGVDFSLFMLLSPSCFPDLGIYVFH